MAASMALVGSFCCRQVNWLIAENTTIACMAVAVMQVQSEVDTSNLAHQFIQEGREGAVLVHVASLRPELRAG